MASSSSSSEGDFIQQSVDTNIKSNNGNNHNTDQRPPSDNNRIDVNDNNDNGHLNHTFTTNSNNNKDINTINQYDNNYLLNNNNSNNLNGIHHEVDVNHPNFRPHFTTNSTDNIINDGGHDDVDYNNGKQDGDEDDVPLLKDHTLNVNSSRVISKVGTNTKDSSTQTPAYSALKAKIVVSLTLVLFSCSFTTLIVSLYLLEYYDLELSFNGTHSHTKCITNQSNPIAKLDNFIQSKVSTNMMYYRIANAIPCFLSVVVWGGIVDMRGRRPALIWSLGGATVQIIIIFVTIKFKLSPNYLFAAFASDGIGGSFIVNLISMIAIFNDISESKEQLISWIGIMLCMNLIVQSGMGVAIGYIIEYVGYVMAAQGLMIPTALAFLVAIFFMPETIPSSVRKQRITPKSVCTSSILRVIDLYTKFGTKSIRWSLFMSLMIFFTSVIVMMASTALDPLFQTHEPLCWSPSWVGYYQAYNSVIKSVGGLIYLKVLRKLGMRDEYIAMSGVLFYAGSFVLEGFARNTWMMALVPVIGIPGFQIVPVARGMMSSLVGPDKQGTVLSSIALIEVGCLLVASTVFNKVYAVTVSFMQGAVYLLMAAVLVITFLLYFPLLKHYNRPSKIKPGIQASDHSYEEDEDRLHTHNNGDGDEECIGKLQ